MGTAIMSQPRGALGGRLKFTEQGQVVFAHYAEPAIAHRHLEQVSSAKPTRPGDLAPPTSYPCACPRLSVVSSASSVRMRSDIFWRMR